MGALAEFERDLLRQRIKSGLDHAKSRGKKLGRQVGTYPSDKYKGKVLQMLSEGRTIAWIAHEMQISTTTVMGIKKRA